MEIDRPKHLFEMWKNPEMAVSLFSWDLHYVDVLYRPNHYFVGGTYTEIIADGFGGMSKIDINQTTVIHEATSSMTHSLARIAVHNRYFEHEIGEDWQLIIAEKGLVLSGYYEQPESGPYIYHPNPLLQTMFIEKLNNVISSYPNSYYSRLSIQELLDGVPVATSLREK